MSQIENVITTTFRARGGNVVSQLGSYAQGFGRIGNVINDNVRMSERLNNQWRAFGTTLRYALAGGAIFGLTRLVGQLRDVNTQLGLMAAIGSTASGAPFSTAQITDLGNQLQSTAIKAITPLNEVNDAAVNFLSTVQNVKPSEIPTILTDIGRAATLAQTPVQDLTQAATTMNIAFGRANNASNISQFTRMWFALISTAPGGISAAPQIAQSMPALASMFQLAPGRSVPGRTGQAQMMSLVLGALRTGMPPATAMRGVTYLLQSLAQPTGGATKALAGIGITPQFVQQNGVYAAVMKLLTTITKTGNAKQLAQIPEDVLSEMDASGGNLPGIPAAEMIRLRKMVPRIHGIRAAIILASQLQAHGNVTSLDQDLQDMQAAQANQAKGAQDMAAAWKRFEKRAALKEASVAINTMGLQVASMFAPILNFAAHGVTGAANFAQHHHGLVQGAAIGGGGFLAALGIGRFLGIGRLPGLNRIPGIRGLLGGGAGSAFVRGRAIESALSGATGIGATPQNPLYVIVVGQIFGGNTPGPTPGPGPTGGTSFFGKLGNLGKRFGGYGLAAGGATIAAAAAIPVIYNEVVKHLEGSSRRIPPGHPLLDRFAANSNFQNYIPTKNQSRILDQFAGGKLSANQAEHALRAMQLFGGNVTGIEGFRQGMLKGRAEIFLTLDQKDASGKIVRKRVHIPVDLWQGGKHPSTRGSAGKTRRGN